MALRTFGEFDVEEADSGVDIVSRARTFRPDIFLLDVMMPEVGGVAAFKSLSGEDDLKNIPVVFMTAKVQSDEIREFRDMGITEVIEKPFDPENLPGKLNSIWNRVHE